MNNKKAYSQLFFMILISLVTQIVAMIRMSVVAENFGTSVEMDAFNFSNSIGTFIFSFISTGVSTVLIPAIIQKKPRKQINSFISIIYSFSILIVILLILFRKVIISLFANGSTEFTSVASILLVITMATQFMHTILGVAIAVFQCRGKYNLPKILNLITALILMALVILDNNLDIYRYAVYVMATNAFNGIIHFILVYREKFIYTPCFDFKDSGVRHMFKIFLPTVFSSGLYQISLLADSMISQKLGEGNISILTYSNTIMSLIATLLTSNLLLYLYPKIAASADKENGKEKLFQYFVFFTGIMLLITVGFFGIGREGIAFLYERGEFTADITSKVYLCTVVYSLGLPINVMRDIIYKYFYAKGLTKITFANSIVASIFNIVISIILSFFIGIYGIALGTVLTSLLSLTTITVRFVKNFGKPQNVPWVIRESVKNFISFIITFIIMILTHRFIAIDNNLISIIVNTVICVCVYVCSLLILKTNLTKVDLR
ncbi:MAG: hypothetical protein E7388_01265 [Ruminococcaceae bacterium]|nr:hypothetical protein [Oscillospiraceae bacterium]